MAKRKLPTQSPQCIDDAAVVIAVHPAAEAFYDRSKNVVRIISATVDADIGFGNTAESAWADARRNVERPPVPELPNRGTSTWSLKFDEEYWKHDRT